jgi:HTH-type transcriptional regulator, sugar sensing transcriptional regulator
MKFANMRSFMEEIYKELQRLGFSQYEIQVYTEVLKNFPITGYEISKRSDVPRAMIYEVVAKLLKKGAVYTATLVPLTYVPLPAKELINRLRKNFD